MPGNLNAVRNPWATYWRRRALRPEDRWALALVRDYVPALIAHRGGESEITYPEQKIAELAAVARVCWVLAMARGDLDAVARFVGAERAALADLGLQRRARPVDPLAALHAAVAAANADRRPEPASSPSETDLGEPNPATLADEADTP